MRESRRSPTLVRTSSSSWPILVLFLASTRTRRRNARTASPRGTSARTMARSAQRRRAAPRKWYAVASRALVALGVVADDVWRQFDMEKLADALQQLQEDDLLKVVQMVHEHKTNDTYVKNDVERTNSSNPGCMSRVSLTPDPEGEFHVDLYTLPEHLVKMLWKFVQEAGIQA